MVGFDVFGPVKGIVADDGNVVQVDILAIFAKVVAIDLAVSNPDVLAGLHGFLGIPEVDVVQSHPLAATEELWGLEGRVGYCNLVGVPDP